MKTPLMAHFNAASAAQAFNSSAESIAGPMPNHWLVWVHEDVFFPLDWEVQFINQIDAALSLWPKLAVVGVYGTTGQGRLAGRVLDRGKLLDEPVQLPCSAGSLDELLFAVRLDTGLRLDPALKFDFYATDVVLQALENGWDCAVVDAYCEHWSSTVQSGSPPVELANRIKKSAAIFEAKWPHNMPITTSCFQINKPGDVANYIDSLATQ